MMTLPDPERSRPFEALICIGGELLSRTYGTVERVAQQPREPGISAPGETHYPDRFTIQIGRGNW